MELLARFIVPRNVVGQMAVSIGEAGICT